jgi:hypothetical protein
MSASDGDDAELLQLGALLEPIEREYYAQIAIEKAAREETGSGRTDCDWDDLNDRTFTVCNDILERRAMTFAGLAVQTKRALMLTNNEMWRDPSAVVDGSERIHRTSARCPTCSGSRCRRTSCSLTPRPTPIAC